MLALSSFPFDVSPLLERNDYQPVEITAPSVQEKIQITDETTIIEQDNENADEVQIIDITISFTGDCTIGSDESYSGNTFDKVYDEVNDPGYFFKR
jgi:hypothetical protein